MYLSIEMKLHFFRYEYEQYYNYYIFELFLKKNLS